MFPARKFLHLDAGFRMHRGGYLQSVDLAYETWGEPNKDRSNGVLLFTGLSPSAHAASSPDDPSPDGILMVALSETTGIQSLSSVNR